MQYKIINPLSFRNSDVKKNALLKFYRNYFKAPKTAPFSKDYWEAIKKGEDNLFYTLDTVLMIYNDHIIDEDLVFFLKLIQRNDSLRSAILEVLQKEELETGWESLSEEVLTTTKIFNEPMFAFDEEEISPLQNQLAEERDKARTNFCGTFFGESIVDFYQYCPSLIAGLNDVNLKKLILSHPVAVSLLADPKLASRIAGVLGANDIAILFATKAEAVPKKQYTELLLKFCRTYKPRVIVDIFQQLQMRLPSTTLGQEDFDIIGENIYSCESYLLNWIAQDAKIFFAYVVSPEHFTRLLRLLADPLEYLTSIIAQRPDIADWVMDYAVAVIATLLRLKTITDQKLVQFLEQTIINRRSLSSILSAQIRQGLGSFATLFPFHANDLVELLLNPTVRRLIKLTPAEVNAYLKDPFLKSVLDRVISEDDAIFEKIASNVSKVDFPLTTGRSSVLRRLAVYSSVEALEHNLTPFEAFALAKSKDWNNLKDKLSQSKTSLQTFSHLIFRLRLEYNPLSKSSFCEFLCDQFLSDRYFEEFKKDTGHIEILLLVGSGTQLVNCLAKIFSSCRSAQQSQASTSLAIMHSNAQRRHLLGRLARSLIPNPVIDKEAGDVTVNIELKKLLSAVNISNILELMEFFSDSRFLDYLDCKLFFQALMSKSVSDRLEILKRIANKALMFKLLTESSTHRFDYLLMQLLSSIEDNDFIFKELGENDLVKWLNSLSFKLIEFFFENSVVLAIRARLIMVLKKYWVKITNYDLLHYLFCRPSLLSEIMTDFSLPSLVNFLISDLGTQIIELLKLQATEGQESQLPKLFSSNIVVFDNLARNSNSLIKVICLNISFGELVFRDWSSFKSFDFTFEELLYRLFSTDYLKVLSVYSKQDNFIALLSSVLEQLPPEIQAKANQICSIAPANSTKNIKEESAHAVVRNKLVSSASQSNLLAQRQIRDQVEASIEVKHLHAQIQRGKFEEACVEIKSTIIKDGVKLYESGLKAKFFPGVFVIKDNFFELLIWLVLNKHLQLASSYLLSLPRDFYEGYKFLVEDPSEKINQIAFTKLIYRLETLVVTCLFTALPSPQNYNLFAELLFLCCENFPDTILTCLGDDNFLNAVLSTLVLYWENKNGVKFEGEIIACFLILKAYIERPLVGSHPNNINFVIGHIAAQTKTLTGQRKTFVTNLFSLENLRRIGSVRLLGQFLRSPEYAQGLKAEQLLELLTSFPSLIMSIIFYPHNLSKLSPPAFVELLPYLTNGDEPTANRASIFCEIFQQQLIVSSNQAQEATTTTSRIFVTLGHSNPLQPRVTEASLSLDEKKLVTFIKINEYLPLIKTPLIENIMQIYLGKFPYQTEFDILKILLLILIEPNKTFVNGRIKSLVNLLVTPEQLVLAEEFKEKIAEGREIFSRTNYEQEESKLITVEVTRLLGHARSNSEPDLHSARAVAP